MMVAHDAVIILVLHVLLPLDESKLIAFATRHTVRNASVTELVRDEDGWKLVTFSAVDHLKREGADVTVTQAKTLPESVTLQLLRERRVPDAGGSRKSRGEVIVVGGSRRSPGAPLHSAEAAMRVARVASVSPFHRDRPEPWTSHARGRHL